MIKQIFALLIICFTALVTLAQTEKYTAPVKWERYKIGDKDVSVLFPKLPILIQSSNICSERETNQYAAYAEGTVYGLKITSKSKQNPPGYCRQKRKFDETSFKSGVSEAKAFLNTEQETKVKLGDHEAFRIKNERYTYWLIDDFKNKRWFELWVTNKGEESLTVKNFIESLKAEKNSTGIEIGNGADRTLGDDSQSGQPEDTESSITSEKDEIEPFLLIVKPAPRYTDIARQNQTQGVVRLRVVFLASGGIGSVVPVRGLPYGLTEQAIAAAMKVVFIPPKRNKINYSVTKLIEYSFSIY